MEIIKDNISTNNNLDLDDDLLENVRIYSDCFASYQPNTIIVSGLVMEIFILIILKDYGLR